MFALSIVVVSVTIPSNPINRVAYDVYVGCYAGIRVWRDVFTATLMVSDYTWSLWGVEGEARKAKLEELHWRNAKRLRDVFNANGGVYIKFGQHLAQMAYLIPDAYVETMQSMLHQAPTSPFDEVEHTIQQSLNGQTIDAVFASLSPVPVASASLAQVHFGVLRNGDEVAVKVQHRFLRHTVESDIKAMRVICRAVHWLAPAFDYNWSLIARLTTALPHRTRLPPLRHQLSSLRCPLPLICVCAVLQAGGRDGSVAAQGVRLHAGGQERRQVRGHVRRQGRPAHSPHLP